MRRNDKSWAELDEPMEPFLPEESSQNGTTQAIEMRNRLVKLEQQMMAQYTAMAAYATIAKNDVESAKVETRADLDRSQATLIGLLEKLRKEINARLDSVANRGRDELSEDDGSRLNRLEGELASTTSALAPVPARERGVAHPGRRTGRAPHAAAGLARQQRFHRGAVAALSAATAPAWRAKGHYPSRRGHGTRKRLLARHAPRLGDDRAQRLQHDPLRQRVGALLERTGGSRRIHRPLGLADVQRHLTVLLQRSGRRHHRLRPEVRRAS